VYLNFLVVLLEESRLPLSAGQQGRKQHQGSRRSSIRKRFCDGPWGHRSPEISHDDNCASNTSLSLETSEVFLMFILGEASLPVSHTMGSVQGDAPKLLHTSKQVCEKTVSVQENVWKLLHTSKQVCKKTVSVQEKRPEVVTYVKTGVILITGEPVSEMAVLMKTVQIVHFQVIQKSKHTRHQQDIRYNIYN
jgi:hypothetical protein